MKQLRQIEQILDLARWAPSGDNTQPWRFEIVSDDHVIVHGFDTRDHCLYDVDGHASHIAIGALLETMCIAASGFQKTATVKDVSVSQTNPAFEVRFTADSNIMPNPLFPCITVRAVQRRALRTRPLTASEKCELEASVGANYSVIWLEGWRRRIATARLMFTSAKIRLTTPEAYEVHRSVIQWNARFSPDKMPDQALGLDPVTTRITQWAMQDWGRITFLNRFLAGTLIPRLELDFVPAVACAGHFLVAGHTCASNVDDYVMAGRAMQRFWLTATRLGLHLQPEMTPLIFSMYAREGRPFSVNPASLELANHVLRQLSALVGDKTLEAGVFMGRIGAGSPAISRSTRLGLDRLILC
jgi:nitroreductase